MRDCVESWRPSATVGPIGGSEDFASVDAVAVLDEITVELFDMMLAISMLEITNDLRCDELVGAIQDSFDLAEQARGAASLLFQGAVLDPNWSRQPSRPKAVWARHTSAVRAGKGERLTPSAGSIGTFRSLYADVPLPPVATPPDELTDVLNELAGIPTRCESCGEAGCASLSDPVRELDNARRRAMSFAYLRWANRYGRRHDPNSDTERSGGLG